MTVITFRGLAFMLASLVVAPVAAPQPIQVLVNQLDTMPRRRRPWCAGAFWNAEAQVRVDRCGGRVRFTGALASQGRVNAAATAIGCAVLAGRLQQIHGFRNLPRARPNGVGRCLFVPFRIGPRSPSGDHHAAVRFFYLQRCASRSLDCIRRSLDDAKAPTESGHQDAAGGCTMR